MEYIDVIKYIDGRMIEIVCEQEVCKSEYQKKRLDKEAAFLNIAREAIYYQIPVKIQIEQVAEGASFGYPKCPRCYTLFYGNRRSAVCSVCGQKLSWEGATNV